MTSPPIGYLETRFGYIREVDWLTCDVFVPDEEFAEPEDEVLIP